MTYVTTSSQLRGASPSSSRVGGKRRCSPTRTVRTDDVDARSRREAPCLVGKGEAPAAARPYPCAAPGWLRGHEADGSRTSASSASATGPTDTLVTHAASPAVVGVEAADDHTGGDQDCTAALGSQPWCGSSDRSIPFALQVRGWATGRGRVHDDVKEAAQVLIRHAVTPVRCPGNRRTESTACGPPEGDAQPADGTRDGWSRSTA